jgi:hypothetical protein
MELCAIETGVSRIADDCDDANADRFPGNPEVCDAASVDEDCSGTPNDVPGGCACTGSGTAVCGTMGRCTGATHMCVSGQWSPCTVVPATEVCDRIVDEDCDGMIDEGLTRTCYRDNDNDGYAPDGAGAETVCSDPSAARSAAPFLHCPLGSTARAPIGAGNVDCCDADNRAHPGAGGQGSPSVCGGYDFDCDGTTTMINTARLLLCSSWHGDQASCNTDRAAGWCSPGMPACGASAGYSSGGCYWSGSCQPTICWPTTMTCR